MVDEIRTRTVELILTQQCNLHCVYCYERHKSKQTMPLELATQKVEKFLSQDDEFELIMIDMFGGEPLLAFDTIKGLMNFVHSRKWPKKHHFSISTNGTLLNDAMKSWFSCHRQCATLMLSLDGTKEAHDRNRCNSYDLVVGHVPYFRENWPHQPVKMTIGPDTIDQAAAGIRNILGLGLKVQANVVFEELWKTGEDKKRIVSIFEQQLDELVDFFAEHEEYDVPMMLDLPIHRLTKEAPGEVPHWCGAGRYMVAVDTDGREYPCQRFTPFCSNKYPLVTAASLGAITSESPTCLINSRCSQCPAVVACPTCQGHNWEVSGNPMQRTDFHCEFILLQLMAAAKLQYKKLQNKVRQLSEPLTEEPQTLAEYRSKIDGILNVMEIIPGLLSTKVGS